MAGAKGLHDGAIEDHKTYGDSVLARLKGAPAALKSRIAAFAAAHKAWRAANDVAQAAKAKRDAAVDAIGKADDAQDASIDDLCVELVGARMGDRKNPLAKFTKLAPSDLKALASPAEEHVDRLGLGKLAHARDGVERSLGVCVQNHDARPLHRDARDEHRERHVDDVKLRGPKRLRDALGLHRRIADEDRRLLGARGVLALGHGFLVSSRTPMRSARRGRTIAP